MREPAQGTTLVDDLVFMMLWVGEREATVTREWEGRGKGGKLNFTSFFYFLLTGE